jgi:hypothetical protein
MYRERGGEREGGREREREKGSNLQQPSISLHQTLQEAPEVNHPLVAEPLLNCLQLHALTTKLEDQVN